MRHEMELTEASEWSFFPLPFVHELGFGDIFEPSMTQLAA